MLSNPQLFLEALCNTNVPSDSQIDYVRALSRRPRTFDEHQLIQFRQGSQNRYRSVASLVRRTFFLKKKKTGTILLLFHIVGHYRLEMK